MKDILSPANRQILKEFAESNVLLAFDYDGTLAPIVADPNEARMRQKTRQLLSELTKLHPVIVISGRSQTDALAKLQGVAVLEVIGNHGLEQWNLSNPPAAEIERWLPALRARLAPFRGVVIEDKAYSVTIHYRRSREKKKVRAAILEAADNLGDTRIVGGKQVVNILPRGAPHKGVALDHARVRLHCDTAIYVGDDETDEDIFVLDQPGRLLAIRVGAKRASAARYYIPNQRAVDELLRALLQCRCRDPG